MRLGLSLSLLALLLPALLSHAAIIVYNDAMYHVDSVPLLDQFCSVFRYLCADQGAIDGCPANVNECSGPYDHTFHLSCVETVDSLTTSDVTNEVFNLADSVLNYPPGPVQNVPLTNYAGEGYCITFQRFCSGFCQTPNSPNSQCQESPTGGSENTTVVLAQCTCGSVDYSGFLNNHTLNIVYSDD